MVDERLIELLQRMQQEDSFRHIAKVAGIGSAETLARVWRREGRLGAESARKLAGAFGVRYGFTEDDLRRWSGLPARHIAPKDAPTDTPADLPELPQDIRFAFREAAQHMPPEELEALLAVIRLQFRTYTRSWVERERGPTRYQEDAP